MDAQTAAGRSWHETRYFGNLVDMHIPDMEDRYLSRFDSRTYVDLLARAETEVAYLSASSCLGLCYWPTRVGRMHAGLKGRDILGERIAGCHERGMTVVVYLNYWSKWAYETHPEWRILTADGLGTADYLWTPGRYGVCCFNSPYRHLVMDQVTELCKDYEFEGLWIDMDFWPHTACYCAHCRRRFLDEAGYELPRRIGWENPVWVTFQRARERWLAGFLADLTAHAKDLRPGMSVGHQCAAWYTGWDAGLSREALRQSDYLSQDFYGGPVEQSFVCKLLASQSEHRLFEYATSRCPDLTEHTTVKSREQLSGQMFATIAHNGRFTFIDAIDPEGTLNPAIYDQMGAIVREGRPFTAHLSPEATLCADVGIYFNFPSLINPRDNGRKVTEADQGRLPLVGAAVNIARTLLGGHLPYGVATLKNRDELDGFQVLVAGDLTVVDDDEACMLREYVRRGGSLYASRNASLLSTAGERRRDFLLGDLFGVAYEGETAETVTYMAPDAAASEAADLFAPYSAAYPLAVNGSQTLVRTSGDARVLARLTLPYTDPRDPARYASAISNPPGRPTDRPALVLNRYGRGRVLYAAGSLENAEHESQREFFRRILGVLLHRPLRVTIDAPRGVEVILLHQRERGRYLVNLLNHQAELPNIPVDGIKVRIHLGDRQAKALRLLPEDTVLPMQCTEGFADFTAPRLDTLLMFALSYEEGSR